MKKKVIEEKMELPTPDELRKLSDEEFQKLIKDVKNRKYQSLSALLAKK